MAALPSIPMDTFIQQYSQSLKDWIEQDLKWKLEDVYSVMIEPEVIDVEEGLAYRKWMHGSLVDVSIDRRGPEGHETRKCQFLQLGSGEWIKQKEWVWVGDKDGSFVLTMNWQVPWDVNGWSEYEAPQSSYSANESGNISYTSSFEVIVEKQEMTDNDAFDLMDSIRKEMK